MLSKEAQRYHRLWQFGNYLRRVYKTPPLVTEEFFLYFVNLPVLPTDYLSKV